jgi:hypothetical protein
MKRLIILIFPLVALLLTRCSRDEGICVGSTGPIITQDRSTLPYHYVEVYDNINLILTQDTSFTGIKVEAGKNLIDGITTEVTGGRLVLKNRNSCSWLRSFGIPVNVYLTFSHLDTLIFRAAGNITCTNDWTNDSIYFNIIEGAGQIDLKLNVFKSFLYYTYGTATVNVSGFSQVTFISSQGYGPIQAGNLYSKFTYLYTFSPNDVFVNVNVQFAVEIRNIGNVYYSGDAELISVKISGGGKLIKL